MVKKVKVYRLVCDETEQDPTLKYFGNTERRLDTRLREHINDPEKYVKWRDEYLRTGSEQAKKNMEGCSKSSHKLVGKPGLRIELVAECETKDEAEIVESTMIKTFACVNKITSRNVNNSRKEQYHEDKVLRPELHQRRLESFATYRKKNKEEISEYLKEKIPCECGRSISRRNMAGHKKNSCQLGKPPKPVIEKKKRVKKKKPCDWCGTEMISDNIAAHKKKSCKARPEVSEIKVSK